MVSAMRHLALAFAVAAASTQQSPACRCLFGDACWPSPAQWEDLNLTVGGRLVAYEDPLAICRGSGIKTPSCAEALNSTDDEFWLTGQVAGYTRSGEYGAWNLSSVASAYAVIAESEADAAAAVSFAAQHNLRFAVKNTGHGWFAGSHAPGGLLLWTHRLSSVTFPASPGAICGRNVGRVAEVGAGAQFRDLYAAAAAAGGLVIGGTCDSVGVGGCWLGGCFGTWSKRYGSGANNILAARIVLADGTLATASQCENADIFWSLRGGGAGVAAVALSFTTRVHAPPASVLLGGATLIAADAPTFTSLLEQALAAGANVSGPAWGGSWSYGRGSVPGTYSVNFGLKGFELSPADGEAALAPLLDWAARTPGVNATSAWSVWNASTAPAGSPPPWIEEHPDREISTAIVATMSRFVPVGDASLYAAVAAGLAAAADAMPANAYATVGVDLEKGQAGAPPGVLADLADSAQPPVLARAAGMLLVAVRFPELPTLPPSPQVLAALWPRLQRYAVLSDADPLYAPCAAGAAGDAAAAAACHALLVGERVPALQKQLSEVKSALYAAMPDVAPDGSGAALSGTYLNEAGFDDVAWQRAQWGDATYARLLAIKHVRDPAGLFYCHHCVGSDEWDPSGQCRL